MVVKKLVNRLWNNSYKLWLWLIKYIYGLKKFSCYIYNFIIDFVLIRCR